MFISKYIQHFKSANYYKEINCQPFFLQVAVA